MKCLSLLFLLFCYGLPVHASTSSLKANLYFIENKGQLLDQNGNIRSDVDFILRAEGIDILISSGRVEYQWKRLLQKSGRYSYSHAGAEMSLSPQLCTHRINVELINADFTAVPEKAHAEAYFERYYLAHTGDSGLTARAYSRITYRNIYPGIDWVLYIKDNKLEYDFVLQEGADANLISIKYSGAEYLQLDNNGALDVRSSLGSFREAKPKSCNEKGVAVTSSFILEGDLLRFALGEYQGKLVIDPVIDWSTYFLGSQSFSTAENVITHGAENIYFSGVTISPGLATTGAFQDTITGDRDIYVSKFDSSGNRIWTTYYGGEGRESIGMLAIDMVDDLYVSGSTNSTAGIATLGSHQPQLAGAYDGFLAKFDTSGARIWATYYGGDTTDYLGNISVSGDNEPYISGMTYSDTGIATAGTYQQYRAGLSDMFLVKFNSAGNRIWGSYYGGTDMDAGGLSRHDLIDGIYLIGYTHSTSGIATLGSHQSTLWPGQFSDSWDLCLARFNDFGQLVWGTYYGGEGEEMFYGGVVCDGLGNAYFTGQTGNGTSANSASQVNISTAGSFQPAPSNNTSEECFLVKFDSAGNRIWGTYFGSAAGEMINGGLAIDKWSNIYFSGWTDYSFGITTPDAWQQSLNSSQDAFVAKFDSAGNRLWCSFFGGEENYENVKSCAFDGYRNLYLVGHTSSITSIATPGSFQEVNPIGFTSGFLTRIEDCIELDTPAMLTGNLVVCANDTLVYSVPGVNGAVFYTWTLPGGWSGNSSTNSISVITGGSGGNLSVTAHGVCGNSQPLVANIALSSPQPLLNVNGDVLSTGSFASYQWYLNGNIIPGATAQSYTMTQPGNYSVVVTDNTGCSGTSQQYLGLEEANMPDFRVYPNPANHVVVVEGGELQTVKIKDLHGREMLNTVLTKPLTELDISFLQPGFYFLSREDNGVHKETVKLLKL